MKLKCVVIFTAFLWVTGHGIVQAQVIDPTDNNANYQKALSLYQSDAAADGIPYLENILKNSSTIKPAAYDLLGNIYDKLLQPDKAIEAYKAGIQLDPAYQNLRFNLGLAYFRMKKYTDAELSAIEAIKLDPKHANSLRLYGLVTFHQDKRVNALLAFCSFLLMDPNAPRASEAYTNIQSILKGGALKPGEGLPATDKNTIALNNGLAAIMAAGKTKKLPPAELLEYQLKSIFIMAGQLSAKKQAKDFFDTYYADFFYKLAQSKYMHVFAQLVGVSGDKEASQKWQQENSQQMTELNAWVKTTERNF
ncbi:MAG: tetratricopeptide repeat protein [Mucilaginibacter sp.]